MSDLFNDLELFQTIRAKINGLNTYFKIAETDVLISAGAVTSIPVVTVTQDLLFSGDKVWLADLDTGTAVELTLADDIQTGDTALTVVEYTFADDVPIGSHIYYKYSDLLSKIYAHLSP